MREEEEEEGTEVEYTPSSHGTRVMSAPTHTTHLEDGRVHARVHLEKRLQPVQVQGLGQLRQPHEAKQLDDLRRPECRLMHPHRGQEHQPERDGRHDVDDEHLQQHERGLG